MSDKLIDFEPRDADMSIAYVRRISKEEMSNPPDDFPDGSFYALHDENGRPIALFKDRATAMVVAKSNRLTPMSVH